MLARILTMWYSGKGETIGIGKLVARDVLGEEIQTNRGENGELSGRWIYPVWYYDHKYTRHYALSKFLHKTKGKVTHKLWPLVDNYLPGLLHQLLQQLHTTIDPQMPTIGRPWHMMGEFWPSSFPIDPKLMYSVCENTQVKNLVKAIWQRARGQHM